MAREFALVGALEALHRAQVPIAAIYAAEVGALLSTAYALEGNINHFEWALQKLRDESFVRKGLIAKLFNSSAGGDKLVSELDQIVGHQEISHAKIPLFLATYPADAGDPTILDKGEASAVLKAALSSPGLFNPDPNLAAKAVGQGQVELALIKQAKASGKSPIVYLDLGIRAVSKDSSIYKDADLVIRPNLKALGYLDYDKRAEAAFRGKTAIQKNLVEIKHQVGMPLSAEDQRDSNQ
jgi:predicted acylesterase/phospholipase RssA